MKTEQHGKQLYEALLYNFTGLRRNFKAIEDQLLELGIQNAATDNEVERVKQATQINDLLGNLYVERDVFDEAVDQIIKGAMALSYQAKDPSFPRPQVSDLRYVWNTKKSRYEPGTHTAHFAAESVRQERFVGNEGDDSPGEIPKDPEKNITVGNFGDKSKTEV